jgi:hypothetical protein
MRWILYASILFLVGCQGVVGPRDRRGDTTRIDHPCLTVEEQKQLSRDRLALPETSPLFVPPGSASLAGPNAPR